MGAVEGEALIVAAGGTRFALPMDRIAQVCAYTPETPVPGTPPAIRGIVERNGAPVHVLDPVKRLFGTAAALDSRACIVFFDDVAGRGAAAIVVERVERIVDGHSLDGDEVSFLDLDALFAFDRTQEG